MKNRFRTKAVFLFALKMDAAMLYNPPDFAPTFFLTLRRAQCLQKSSNPDSYRDKAYE